MQSGMSARGPIPPRALLCVPSSPYCVLVASTARLVVDGTLHALAAGRLAA
jgi:hypothetical protein